MNSMKFKGIVSAKENNNTVRIKITDDIAKIYTNSDKNTKIIVLVKNYDKYLNAVSI